MDELIHLRNGTQVSKEVAKAVYGKLLFLNEDPPAPERLVLMVEFMMFCRDPDYKLDPVFIKLLQEGELLQADGSVKDDVKNVVISATAGKDQLEFALIPPAVRPPQAA